MHVSTLNEANEISKKMVRLKKAKQDLEAKHLQKSPIPISMSNAWHGALDITTLGTSSMDRIYTIMIQTIDSRINELKRQFSDL